MDRQTRHRLEDLFRSAYWSALTDKDMADAGIPEPKRPEFIRRAEAIHAAYKDGSHADALDLLSTAVAELGGVVLEEPSTSGANDPRSLAAHALGETGDPDLPDDQDPRKLADGIEIY